MLCVGIARSFIELLSEALQKLRVGGILGGLSHCEQRQSLIGHEIMGYVHARSALVNACCRDRRQQIYLKEPKNSCFTFMKIPPFRVP